MKRLKKLFKYIALSPFRFTGFCVKNTFNKPNEHRAIPLDEWIVLSVHLVLLTLTFQASRFFAENAQNVMMYTGVHLLIVSFIVLPLLWRIWRNNVYNVYEFCAFVKQCAITFWEISCDVYAAIVYAVTTPIRVYNYLNTHRYVAASVCAVFLVLPLLFIY